MSFLLLVSKCAAPSWSSRPEAAAKLRKQADKASWEKIANAIRSNGNSDVTVRIIPGVRSFVAAGPCRPE
jgi:hypothetical protein